MKNLILTLLFALISEPIFPHPAEIENLLVKLDSLLTHQEDFLRNKEAKIAELREKRNRMGTTEEQYWLNKMLYDEYFVFNADSAMSYVAQNLILARRLDKPEWEVEWKIKKSFILVATGLLKEAFDELKDVEGRLSTRELKVEYYSQIVYLYSHFGFYSTDSQVSNEYYRKEEIYKDSVYRALRPSDALYLWHKGWKFMGTDSVKPVKEALLKEVATAKLDSRFDAMNAYMLAHLCRTDGQTGDFLKYLIYSGMADIRICNKDIASLEELAKELFALGDIDRAYTYTNYCLQHAQLYHNRIRILGIASLQDGIRQAYQQRDLRQKARLHLFLILVSILSIVLLGSYLLVYRQRKRLSLSRAKLNETNRLLNRHVAELSEARNQLSGMNIQLQAVNDELQSVNRQLKETNGRLRESNYVKEEYIGYVFTLCSNYISKLEEFRKNINRKAKAKQFDDIKTLTDTRTMAQSELKEFYQNFDAIFLHVYPDFVSDFNALLRPEEQIVLKEGELLTTELRIYALVRLGINDSVKIAEFLHCSPQTVYNNRLKTRNKAVIPKEDFARTVQSLGKMQRGAE